MKKRDQILKTIIIVCGLIIFLASLEALDQIKSRRLLEAFLEGAGDRNPEDYRLGVMLNYGLTILDAIIIAIYSFFTLGKKPNRFYKLIFAGLVLIRLVNIGFKFQLLSIYYYGLILLYLILLIQILRIPLGGDK